MNGNKDKNFRTRSIVRSRDSELQALKSIYTGYKKKLNKFQIALNVAKRLKV